MLVVGSLYFVTLVVVGAIFLMNLIVAVIVTTLSVENDVAWEDDMERMASQQVDDDDGFPPVAPRHRRSSLLVTQQLVKHRRASNHGARRGSSGDKGLAGNCALGARCCWRAAGLPGQLPTHVLTPPPPSQLLTLCINIILWYPRRQQPYTRRWTAARHRACPTAARRECQPTLTLTSS